MFSYRCVFRDYAGALCGQVNVTADDFDQIESWASEIITKGNAKPKGVEIWHGEERLASYGTAFRPERRRTSRRRRQQQDLSQMVERRITDKSASAARRCSWLGTIMRRVLG